MSFLRKPVVLRKNNVDMTNFDWEVYLLNHPELALKGIRTKNDACNHYRTIGYWEKWSFQVPPSFNAERYIQSHSHLDLKSPRDAYLHFMKIGTIIRRNEGVKRTSQAYRVPATRPPYHRKHAMPNSTPPPPPPRPLPPRRIAQPAVVKQLQPLRPNILFHAKRKMREPKPGELVLREPPSVYFARMGVLGSPKYIN